MDWRRIYYQGNLKGQTYKSLTEQGVDIPSRSLGIGQDADRATIHVQYTQPKQKSPVIQPVTAIENSTLDGQGNPVTWAPFPNYGYFGDALGNMGGEG